MALIALATICSLGCALALFTLVQWIRDERRQARTRPNVDDKADKTNGNHAHGVGFLETKEGSVRFKGRVRHLSRLPKCPCVRERGHDDRERMAYEKIARFAASGKRT